ncbi:MAG TPA: MFS transporter, partial [Mycobacteriales bacterium]
MAAEAVGQVAPRGHAEPSSRRAWAALAALLTGTFLGTINNNIVNVPLRDITVDLGVPVSAGVLVVVAFSLTFAVLMPVLGWLGDRIGRRRVFCAALAGIA